MTSDINRLELELLRSQKEKIEVRTGGLILHLNYCDAYKCSRIQRITEINRGDGLKGTDSYREKGCFDCTGFRKECYDTGSYTDYLSLKSLIDGVDL